MKVERIAAIICLIIMFLIGFGTLISDNKEPIISEDENRMLAGMPKLSFESIVNGEFASEYEEYMIDRIPFRSSIINIKDSINQSMSIVTMEDAMNIIDTKSSQQMEGLGDEITETVTIAPSISTTELQTTPSPYNAEDISSKSTPTATPDPNKFSNSPNKYIGFFESDSDTMTLLIRFNTEDIIAYADTLNELASLLPDDGNLVYVMSLESIKSRPVISSIGEGNDITMVDETVEILEYYIETDTHIISAPLLFEEPLKNTENMYFFTDPHWSVEGAYCSYSEAMNKIGITPVKWEDYDVEYEYPFRGAYFKKSQTSYYMENPDTLAIVSFPQASSFTHYLGEDNSEELPIIYYDSVDDDRYRVYFDGPQAVGPLGVIETTSNTKRNALVILDSYGLSFSNMLIPHYDTICMMDLRYMYKSTKSYYISDIVDEYDVNDIYVVVGDLNAYGTFYHTLIDKYLQRN